MSKNSAIIIPENPVSSFLFSDTRSAVIWLFIRVYVGYAWLTAGWGKVRSDAWTGENAGAAIKGFVSGAIAKSQEGGDVIKLVCNIFRKYPYYRMPNYLASWSLMVNY